MGTQCLQGPLVCSAEPCDAHLSPGRFAENPHWFSDCSCPSMLRCSSTSAVRCWIAVANSTLCAQRFGGLTHPSSMLKGLQKRSGMSKLRTPVLVSGIRHVALHLMQWTSVCVQR